MAGVLPGAVAGLAAMSIQDVLQRITSALDQAGITYMLTGSFASAYYGAARSTQDIDFVIQANSEQLRSFIEALPENYGM